MAHLFLQPIITCVAPPSQKGRQQTKNWLEENGLRPVKKEQVVVGTQVNNKALPWLGLLVVLVFTTAVSQGGPEPSTRKTRPGSPTLQTSTALIVPEVPPSVQPATGSIIVHPATLNGDGCAANPAILQSGAGTPPPNYIHQVDKSRLVTPIGGLNGDGRGVEHIGTQYSSLTMINYPHLKTKAVISRRGMVPPNAKAIIVYWHGWGPTRSNMGSVLMAMKVLSAAHDEAKFVRKVRTESGAYDPADMLGSHLELGGIAYDFAGHGHSRLFSDLGPGTDQTLEITAAAFGADLARLKAQYNLPIFILGRSAGPSLALEVNRRFPGVISGIMGLALSHSKPEIDAKVVADIYQNIRKGKREADPYIMAWTNLLFAQMRWHTWEDPAGGTPLLLMNRSTDPQVPIEARDDFSRLMSMFPGHIRYREFAQQVANEDDNHDLFSLASDNRAVLYEVFGEIYEFLRANIP